MLWRCTVCYGGVLCGRSMYCVVGLFAVCYGGVMCAMVMYCVVGRCTVY